MTNFHPDHLADLKKSGLSDETIKQAEIHTVIPPRQIDKKLGFNMPGLLSMYEIPYQGCDSFSRFRGFYEEGKAGPKYLQRKDSGNHLYIPALATSILSDPAKPLYFTEGEKKTLKACQEGILCIGLSGLWNWKIKDGGLIPDFDKIELKHRTVYIVPDNDWRLPNKHGYEKNLEQAVQELAYSLIDRGANVFIVELPDGPAKGIDDYLLTYSVDKFLSLHSKQIRKLTIEGAIAEATKDTLGTVLKRLAVLKKQSELEMHVKALADKFKISFRSIIADIKAIQKDKGINIEADIYVAHPSLEANETFFSLGFREKIVTDGKPNDRNFFLVSHNGSVNRFNEPIVTVGSKKFIFEERDRILVELRDRWDSFDMADFLKNHFAEPVYDRIKTVLSGYVEFQHPAHLGLLAAWIIGTYYHRLFNAYPFLFFSGKKLSGKSRGLDLIERLAFNAFKIKGVTVAAMADSLDGVRGTLCIDQAEILADKKYLELLGILADSYTTGGGKRRIVNITPKGRRLLEFETYGPKAFASIKELDSDLLDRCILVPMLRARHEYPYPEPFLPIWKELRSLLYRNTLHKWQEVMAIYPEAGQGTIHRVRELWRPLDTILILEQVTESERLAIRDVFLKAMIETQQELDEREELLFEALFKLLTDKESATLTAKEIGKEINGDNELFKNDRAKETWIGKCLTKLSLYERKLPKDRSKQGAHPYLIVSSRIRDIYERYQVSGASGEVVQTQAVQDLQGAPLPKPDHFNVVQKETDDNDAPLQEEESETHNSLHKPHRGGSMSEVVHEKTTVNQDVHHTHHMNHLFEEPGSSEFNLREVEIL